MGKSSQTQSTSQQRDPYAPAQPLVSQSIGGVNDWLGSSAAKSVYDGARAAGTSDYTTQGLSTLANSAGSKQAQGYFQGVLGGDYTKAGNPYQSQLDDSIVASIMPRLNGQFGGAGLAGSTLHQGTVTNELTRGLAAPRYQQYEAERQRQQQAASGLAALDAQIGQNQLQAGSIAQSEEQRAIDAQRAQWEEQRLAALRPYMETQGLTNSYANLGGTSSGTTTTSTSPSLGQTLMGVGMMGAGLYSGMPSGMFGRGVTNPNSSRPWGM